MEEKNLEGLKYLVSYPEGFQENQKYPLVIFLHGVGTCSETTEKLRENSAFLNLQMRQTQRGYILLAPLCRSGTWNEWMPQLIQLVEQARALPYVDATRVHLTGLSMGGYGTWFTAMARPDLFAAIAPVCGGGMAWNAEVLKMPIWVFHGSDDRVVSPTQSDEMVAKLNECGADVKYSRIDGVGHGVWENAYNEQLILWLLKNAKNDN